MKSAVLFGWEDRNGLVPVYFKGQMSSDCLQDLICTCKGKSVCMKGCICFEQSLSCTDLCPCQAGDLCRNENTHLVISRNTDEDDDIWSQFFSFSSSLHLFHWIKQLLSKLWSQIKQSFISNIVTQALVSFKQYMPPPLPYFKGNIYHFPLPHFASILFAYLWSFRWRNYIVNSLDISLFDCHI